MQNSFNLDKISNEYNMLMSSLHISVSKHLLNQDFTVIWANSYFYEMTGYSEDEYNQKYHGNCRMYFEGFPKEYEKISQAVMNAIENNEDSYDEICKMPKKDGTSIWIRFVGTFTNEMINGIPVIYVVYTDVDDMINAQNRLELEHQKLLDTLKMEMLTMDCIKKMYSSVNMSDYMFDILRIIGVYLDARHVYFYEDNHCVYEWYKDENKEVSKRKCLLANEFTQTWYEELNQGKSVIVSHLEEIQTINDQLYQCLSLQGVSRFIVSPLLVHSELNGIIVVENPDMELIEHASMIETLNYFISISIEKARLNEKLIYNSFYDKLTGAYNRNKYLQDIQKLSDEQMQESIGIIYMDINGLKDINDHMGHMLGDTVLIEGVDILRKVFPDGDIYRLGGDEFVVLVPKISKEKFERDVRNLKQYLLLSVYCKGAIGYVWTENCMDLNQKISDADEFMYKDKMHFYRNNPMTNRYRYHNDNIIQLTKKDIILKDLKDHKFEVYLQPKVDFNKQVIGCEALIRYHDKDNHLVMPNEFIPSLEEARMIKYIDFYVFDQACQLLQKWQNEGLPLYPISVNFSRYTLRIPEYLSMLDEVWKQYHIDKSLLEIEIIENDENVDNEFLISIIDKIKKAGFAISIDDFGARYSNMALFINANLDTLKVDKSLMDDMEKNERSRMLIASLVQICHNLDIQLIAEGVESQEQFSILRTLECDGVQGYLISKPICIAEYEKKFLCNKE